MTAAPPAHPARFGPRFSLRLLLVTVTAFAIGFPIWYRWPYDEEERIYPERNGAPDKTRSSVARRVTSWRRQWGGARLKHGRLTTFLEPDRGREEVTYRDGKKHGPARTVAPDGRVIWLGDYIDDELTCEMSFRADGAFESERGLVRGKQHGEAKQHFPSGHVVRYRFDHGRVTHIDDRAVKSPLLGRLSQGTVDEEMARRLTRGASPEFGDTLREVLQSFGNESGIPMVIDPCASTSGDKPDFTPGAIDLASAVVITAQAAGCECDYHNGCIWVLPSFGEHWADPTGVAEIRPPEGTVLAAQWLESIGRVSRGPLAVRLSEIAERCAISIDTTRVQAPADHPGVYLVEDDVAFMQLRHALTIVLFHNGCRCELRGETLVILPPE